VGKGTELVNELKSPLTPEEIEDSRPKLRLRADVFTQAFGPNAEVKDVLDRLADETVGEVAALHDAESGTTAIVVPVERYLELITSHISDRNLSEVTLDNRVVPSEAILSGLGVEQVDPKRHGCILVATRSADTLQTHQVPGVL
jgi:hypothetical protein